MGQLSDPSLWHWAPRAPHADRRARALTRPALASPDLTTRAGPRWASLQTALRQRVPARDRDAYDPLLDLLTPASKPGRVDGASFVSRSWPLQDVQGAVIRRSETILFLSERVVARRYHVKAGEDDGRTLRDVVVKRPTDRSQPLALRDFFYRWKRRGFAGARRLRRLGVRIPEPIVLVADARHRHLALISERLSDVVRLGAAPQARAAPGETVARLREFCWMVWDECQALPIALRAADLLWSPDEHRMALTDTALGWNCLFRNRLALWRALRRWPAMARPDVDRILHRGYDRHMSTVRRADAYVGRYIEALSPRQRRTIVEEKIQMAVEELESPSPADTGRLRLLNEEAARVRDLFPGSLAAKEAETGRFVQLYPV